MKPTDTNLATFYGLTRQTISKYRKSKEKSVKRIYDALLQYFKTKGDEE